MKVSTGKDKSYYQLEYKTFTPIHHRVVKNCNKRDLPYPRKVHSLSRSGDPKTWQRVICCTDSRVIEFSQEFGDLSEMQERIGRLSNAIFALQGLQLGGFRI